MTKIIDNTNLGYLISKIKAAFWPKTDVVQIGLDNTPTANSNNLVKSGGVKTALDAKQDTLVSGTNIKTINNTSLLGSGNITITGDGSVSGDESCATKVYMIEPSELTLNGLITALPNGFYDSVLEDLENGIFPIISASFEGGALEFKFDVFFESEERVCFSAVTQPRIYILAVGWDPFLTIYNLNDFQQRLVSGTNIKTINNNSLLGSGDIVIPEGNAKIFYGTCSTAGDAVAKTVVCPSFTSADLVKGALVFVTFENTNSAAVADLTMSVNSTTAAHIIKLYNTTANPDLNSAGELKADKTYLFSYDGTRWVCLTLDYNTSYSAMTQAIADAGTDTSNRTIKASILSAAILNKMKANQADWNQTDTTAADYIKNKPDCVLKSGGTLNNSATLTLPSASTDNTVIGNGIIELQGGSGEVGIKLDGTSPAVCVSSQSAIISSTADQTKYKDSTIVKRSSNTEYTLTIPSKTGTLAVTTDIPSAVTESTVSGWGFTKNTGTLTGVKVNGSNATVTSGVADIGTVITSETQLSKGTTSGSGNAVTDISVSGHQITLTKGTTFLTSHQDISGKANLSGAAFTGAVTGTSSGNTAQFRNVTISSSEPTSSQGSNGDIWIVI